MRRATRRNDDASNWHVVQWAFARGAIYAASMTAARRAHEVSPSPAASEARAKSLRIGEVRPETRAVLGAFESAARDWESARATITPGGEQLDDRFLRSAAADVLDALVRDLREGRVLPADLAADVERWLDGEFAGSDADVEIANHAIWSLLGSDVVAELDRAAE